MLDLPMRLVVAYGLIGLLVLALLAVALWNTLNSQGRRDRREQARLAERYRVREEALAVDRAPASADEAALQTTR